jgi:hypothetical protein
MRGEPACNGEVETPASSASGKTGYHPQRKLASWTQHDPVVPTEEGGLACFELGDRWQRASMTNTGWLKVMICLGKTDEGEGLE